MIAASEPLEFVPHGRTVLAKHPEQIYGKANSSTSENSLLYKLTNFAIKDESLLETKEEQEWWCVREVYYNAKYDFEEDPQSPKDTKEEGMSDSFQPTSRLKQDFNLSINTLPRYNIPTPLALKRYSKNYLLYNQIIFIYRSTFTYA